MDISFKKKLKSPLWKQQALSIFYNEMRSGIKTSGKFYYCSIYLEIKRMSNFHLNFRFPRQEAFFFNFRHNTQFAILQHYPQFLVLIKLKLSLALWLKYQSVML